MNSPARLKLSKLDVARRQLDAAVEMWFSEKDPVPIHTLASAAHEVFSSLCRHRGLPPLMFDPALCRPGKARLAKRMLNTHYNFFKHASSDPDDTTEFPPELSEIFIYVGIEGWRVLGGQRKDLDDAFMLNFLMRHPNAHRVDTPELVEQFILMKRVGQMMPIHDRGEFLRDYLFWCDQVRAARRSPG
jgi:hypothetical protein